MSFKAAVCGALGVLCATSAGYRRVENAALRFSAELPQDWGPEAPGKDSYRPTAKGAVFSGIDVIFLDEGDAALFVKTAANPSPELRRARKFAEFRAQPVEHRRSWLIVETYQKTEKGEVEFSLHAALPAAGGYYGVSFWADTAEGFKRGRPVFEHWLDTFRVSKP